MNTMIHLKNESQIDGIRKSCKLLAQLFEELIPELKAGMSTADIDALCVAFITKHGGNLHGIKKAFLELLVFL